MLFSRAHKGAYMDLLMTQFNFGHLSLDDVKTVLGADFDSMWESRLSAKFSVDDNGLFFNKRLEDEKNKRIGFTESRRKNLDKQDTHMEQHMDTHMESHMEHHMEHHMGTHMENENKDKNNNKDLTELDKKNEKPKKERKRILPAYLHPPTVDEVRCFFAENGYKISEAERCFMWYANLNWKNTKGKNVIDWKATVQKVWFRPENLETNKKPVVPKINGVSADLLVWLTDDILREERLLTPEQIKQVRDYGISIQGNGSASGK